MKIIVVKKRVLGRPIAKQVTYIKDVPKQINIGYGPGQLRPDGSRQPSTERSMLAKISMLVNGMSGQNTG